jgi:hypothetical protein
VIGRMDFRHAVNPASIHHIWICPIDMPTVRALWLNCWDLDVAVFAINLMHSVSPICFVQIVIFRRWFW